MKTFILASLCGLLLFVSIPAAAQIGGPTHGTIGPGTFTVIDNVIVEAESTLVVNPGTVFFFTGGYKFNIYGYFEAAGTPSDSIWFLRHPEYDVRWGSVIFQTGSSDSSRMNYCYL